MPPYTNLHHASDFFYLLVYYKPFYYLTSERQSQIKNLKGWTAVCACGRISMLDFAFRRKRQAGAVLYWKKHHMKSQAQIQGSGKAFPVMTLLGHRTNGFWWQQLKEHDLVEEIQCACVWIWSTQTRDFMRVRQRSTCSTFLLSGKTHTHTDEIRQSCW